MDPLERELRQTLERHAETPSPSRDLADHAVAGARRVRRRRTAIGAAALAAVVAGGLAFVPAALDEQDPPTAAASLTGAPQLPVFLPQTHEVVDWPDGHERVRDIADGSQPVASLDTGLLLLAADRGQLLLLPDGTAEPHVLTDGVPEDGAVAVAADGTRVSVVVTRGGTRQLVELELPAGQPLRSVPLAPPLADADESVVPVGYSGERVLLSVWGDDGARSAIWEPGEDSVVGTLDQPAAVIAAADGIAVLMPSAGEGCVEVLMLEDGDESWDLCDEEFRRLSPGGSAVLTRDRETGELVVRDAEDGELRRKLETPEPVQLVHWESDEAVLFQSVDDADHVNVVRCLVNSGECRAVSTLPAVGSLVPRR